MSVTKEQSISTKEIMGHPRGLCVLFFSEMWERFGFYGLRALLVLFLTKKLLLGDTHAYGVYAAFMALVYTSPIIGGVLADKILGNRRAIVVGAILIAVGHFFLIGLDLELFYVGLAFIVSGTGFFKANISSMVGQLYERGDTRRDAGFTIFYVGVNLGAFVSSLIVGYIGEVYGWQYGFGLSGVGMLLGLVTFLYGMPSLSNIGVLPPGPAKKTFIIFTVEQWIYLIAFISAPLFAILIANHQVFDLFLPVVGAMVLMYVLYLAFTSAPHERNALLVILVLMFFHTSFFALFEQAGCSLNLFTDRNVDRVLFGYTITASQFQALNPAFIMLLGPLFAWLWTVLGRRNKDPYPPMKFVFALVQISLSFATLVWGIKFADSSGLTPVIWLVISYLFSTVGELCMMPVGLSMVTKLAPTRIISMMMGIWFLSVAFAEYLVGIFAKLAAVTTTGGTVADAKASLVVYSDAFTIVAYFAIIMAVILLVISPLLKPVFARLEAEHK